MKTEKYTLIEILEALLLQMHDHNDYTVNRVDRLSPCCAEYTIEHMDEEYTFSIREGNKEDLNKAITKCNKALGLAKEKEEKPKQSTSLLDHLKSGQYHFLKEVVEHINQHYKGHSNIEIQGNSKDPALRITTYTEQNTLRTEISFFFYPTSFTSVDAHLFVDRALLIDQQYWEKDIAESYQETMTVMPCDLIPHEIASKLLTIICKDKTQ